MVAETRRTLSAHRSGRTSRGPDQALLLLLAWVGGWWVAPPGVLRAQASALVLEEVASYPIPSDLDFRSLAVDDGDRAVLWGYEAPFLVVLSSDLTLVGRVALPPGIRPMAAAFDRERGFAVVVSHPHPAVIYLTEAGELVTVTHLRGVARILAATMTDRGWAALAEGLDGKRFVDVLPDAAAREASFGLPTSRAFLLPSNKVVSLAPATRGVLVTDFHTPFTSTLIRDGRDVLTLQPPLDHPWLAATDPLGIGTGVAMPVLPLDDGYLQVLAEPTSDSRLVVRFTSQGRVAQASGLDAPFGTVASRPDALVLVAVRNVGTMELVKYRWHWVAPP